MAFFQKKLTCVCVCVCVCVYACKLCVLVSFFVCAQWAVGVVSVRCVTVAISVEMCVQEVMIKNKFLAG